MIKVETYNLQAAAYNMQQGTCNRPISQVHNCNKSYKLQGNGRRHVPCLSIRGAHSQQAADTIHSTVRCDWLQPVSCKFMHNIVHAQYDVLC